MTAQNSIRLLVTLTVVFLCLAALTAAAPPRPAVSVAGASDLAGVIRILPQSARVDSGGTVTVDVWVEGVGNYYGIDIHIMFEKAKVGVPGGSVTPVWEVLDEQNHFAIKNAVQVVDSTYDQVLYALTNINPAEPFTGTGRLCSITFSGLAEGATSLDFTYAKASTRDGDALYPTQVDGSIVVAGHWHRVRFPVAVME